MTKENKNYRECMEVMDDFVTSFAELDMMEYGDEESHLKLGTVLAAMIADMQPQADQISTFKHFYKRLAVVVWRSMEGDQDWEDVEYLARDLVSHLPGGWGPEDVEGFRERATDAAKGVVPMASQSMALAH